MDEEEKDLQILNESKLLSHYYNAILPKIVNERLL